MRRTLLPLVLRYVDQVARSGSIQGAAKELHVAASAVNRQILQLEEELGVPLFERLHRGMRLTSPGASIVTLARKWRADERRASDDIRQMQGIHQGHLTLAVMDSHSTGFVPAFLKEVARKHARISLTIEVCSPDDALAALVGDRVDLAAVFNAPPRRDLHVLWQQELPFGCVVAPDHPLARAGSVSLQEVCAHPIALQSKALVIRRYLESHYSWLLNDLRSTVETNSLQLVKMLVRDNGYAAFTSELDAAPELAQGSLVFVPVRDKGVEPQTVSLLMAAAKPMSPMVKVVANGMQAHIIAALEAARA